MLPNPTILLKLQINKRVLQHKRDFKNDVSITSNRGTIDGDCWGKYFKGLYTVSIYVLLSYNLYISFFKKYNGVSKTKNSKYNLKHYTLNILK